jgi:3-hydroxybenzoate 6-monooxygenase
MTSKASPLPILVAGGGIGGLTAALGLAQKGFSVVVLEKAPELGEIGEEAGEVVRLHGS